MKFTQEIKDAWIQKLESGEIKQGFGQLYREEDNSYCCYGVLSLIIGDENLNSPVSGKALNLIYDSVGSHLADELWRANDKNSDRDNHPRDFSNVLPLIKKLPVQEP